MEAVFNCLWHFQTFLQGKHVVICGDNVTCLAYLRKQGGTVSRKLSIRAEQILQWIFHHQISFSTEFVPGNLNVLADQLSRRNQILPTEGTITHQALQPIWERWGKPMVDLFATQYSHRLPLYVSPMRDHKAIGKDALARSWANMEVYAYPPTSLLQKVLAKAAIERPRLILIAPFWRASPWFPDLMSLAREGPVFLNLTKKTLVQPRSGIGNERAAFLNLTAWLL